MHRSTAAFAAALATALAASLATVSGVPLTGALFPMAYGQSSIGDCEKIQAADAYNQCLAKFGPVSKSKTLQPERPGDIKSGSEDAAAGAGARTAKSAPPTESRPEEKAKPERRGRTASRHRGERRTARAGRRGRSSHGRVVRGGGRKRAVFTVRRRRR